MNLYIQAAASVSPQASFKKMMTAPKQYAGDRLSCVEPDYTQYVDAKLIRRMSRIIKMGVAAASECLKEANVSMPDAIITGTAYGCLADTDQFLTRMVEFKEELLSPTAFIQSTHNTVGAQIALMLKCHQYNNTFVHRGSSFEAALMDAQLLINEGDAATVLIGAVDEIIEKSHQIIKRFGIYKEVGDTATLIKSNTSGTMAGEGAAFFLLNNEKNEDTKAQLTAFENYYKPATSVQELLPQFLSANNIDINTIDLVINGANGDVEKDGFYKVLSESVFKDKIVLSYKQYCGEYPTSAAFALWMATQLIQHGYNGQQPKNILIYNNYKQSYPSLFVVSAC